MDGVLGAVEALPLVAALRTSSVLYPLVSALHVLGVALLVGGIVALDLRVVGLWKPEGWREAMGALVPVAAVGLALALVTGALLFGVRATRYAENPAMLVKAGLILAGALNVVTFHRMMRRRDVARPTPGLRASAGVSAAAWIGALFAGRWIAFVG